jgi:hypothetical protein
MELIFGANVREHGHRAGRLAGLELEASTRRVRKVIFSGDGELGNHAVARPFSSVGAASEDIEIRPYTPSEDAAPREGVVLLSHATRIIRSGHEVGRLIGIEVVTGPGELQAVIGRKNWWTRRFRVDAASLDLSVPGEIRTGGATSRAA